MGVIKRIEIQYFRSIYSATIKEIGDINILTGKNDVGKSNVLKALNLFFNNKIEIDNEFNFEENFNLKRLEEVRSNSIKGKQFIRIKVTFNRGDASEKTLPSTFSVTKKWYRNDVFPSEVKNDVELRMKTEKKKYTERSKTSLTRFLNRIKFFYIPAIKDKSIYNNMIKNLKEVIYDDSIFKEDTLTHSLDTIASIVLAISKDLSEDFFKATGIKSQLIPPRDIQEIYRTLEIITKMEQGSVGLFERGDGIKVRYIPSILSFISKNTSKVCLWGYEEPENSLEYNLALEMAQDFYRYSFDNQIFLTTHSPAFIKLEEKGAYLYRCFKREGLTYVISIEDADKLDELSVELGYMRLLNEYFEVYENKINELENLKRESDTLKQQILHFHKPVLMTEGKTDVLILKEAWKRLYKYECPFEIKSCNPYPEGNEISSAGCSMLERILISWKFDSPNLLIGLFDNDADGIKSFSLGQNFEESENGNWKKHKNGKAYALLLPIIKNREIFAEKQNLCIEFYFENESLKKKVDGKGLELDAADIVEKSGNIIVKTRKPDIEKELYLFKPKRETKTWFAEKVVPSFADSEFENFGMLFKQILQIIEDYNMNLVARECATMDEGMEF